MAFPVEEILSWGQAQPGKDAPLSMFILAIRMSQFCNGVSELHGKVARRMWAHVWPKRPVDEIPITHITNGVHVPSWISFEIALLFERYLGPEWYLNAWNQENNKRIAEIYDEELWRAHEMNRTRLIRICRSLMMKQYGRRNAPKSVMKEAESVLDPGILTIAFARRFATYKRATLLLSDPDRLEAMITSRDKPVQLIFAGKAHPKDTEGKELIKQIIQFARRADIRHRIVFLEDYDISIARYLVQGADVWLNNPRRPFEACGTSGMKAAANGVLNVSILDGWWVEGYSSERGWSIGNGEEYAETAYQDVVESQALYNVLENEVIPCFYERENGDVPLRWLKMMKASMMMAMQQFCSHTMVGKYNDMFYMPGAQQFHDLVEDKAVEAKKLTEINERLKNHWENIRIEKPVVDLEGPFRVGETFNVTTRVHLGELRPDDVEVQVYYGLMKFVDVLDNGRVKKMDIVQKDEDGIFQYTCSIICEDSGRYGFTIRVTPKGDSWLKFTPGFITWG